MNINAVEIRWDKADGSAVAAIIDHHSKRLAFILMEDPFNPKLNKYGIIPPKLQVPIIERCHTAETILENEGIQIDPATRWKI